jgi:hypothetical protein
MRWLPPAILALALFVILPAAATGWLADDAFYSALPGILGADRITLWQAMAHSFHMWFFGNGRFYPGLIVEKYLVFDLFTNLVAYKIFLTAATLAALEMFRRCVQAYTTPAFAALCALTAAALFLIHGYQDALIAYNAMPQLVAVSMFGSFLAFRAALAGRSRAMAVTAVMLYVLAALTYEDVYLLCVIYPLLARPLTGNWRAAVRASVPYIAVAAALALFELGLHGWVRLPPGALYAVYLNPVFFLKTAFYQVTAALPFAYWIADPLRSFPVLAIDAFIGFAVIGWFALRAVERADPKRFPLGTGVLVAILPALPVAVLVKYQHELRLGIGYLPVFFQTFGVALLLALALAAAVRSRGSGARIAAAFLLGVLGAGAYASNVQLARAQQPARTARAAFESAVANGLLKKVPDGSTITVPKTFDWIDYDDSGPDGISTRGLLYEYGGKRADLEAPGDKRARYGLSYSDASGTWSLYRILPRVNATRLPGACNAGAITNGDFTFGFSCWAQVATMRGNLDGFPQFRIEAAGACLPPSIAGNPYAAVDVPGGASAYLAQTFRYRGTPTRITLRAWGVVDPVTVRIGVVFPVGTGIGTEKILDTFVAPAIQQASGLCSGLQPLEKHYAFSGYARGAQIQLRLHAASKGSNAAIAAFDDAVSSP